MISTPVGYSPIDHEFLKHGLSIDFPLKNGMRSFSSLYTKSRSKSGFVDLRGLCSNQFIEDLRKLNNH